MSKPRKATRAEDKLEAAILAMERLWEAADDALWEVDSQRARRAHLRRARKALDAAESALTEWQALRAKGAQEGDRG